VPEILQRDKRIGRVEANATTSTLETSLIGNAWCARGGDRKRQQNKKRWREGLQESSGREYRELGRWFETMKAAVASATKSQSRGARGSGFTHGLATIHAGFHEVRREAVPIGFAERGGTPLSTLFRRGARKRDGGHAEIMRSEPPMTCALSCGATAVQFTETSTPQSNPQS